MISESWKQLEGTFLEGKYILERCLIAENGKAVFLTELAGDKSRSAAIKVMAHDDGDQVPWLRFLPDRIIWQVFTAGFCRGDCRQGWHSGQRGLEKGSLPRDWSRR